MKNQREEWEGELVLYLTSAGDRRRTIHFIRTLLAEERQKVLSEVRKNVGMLRQWLNEDRITDKKMVTNEEIEFMLGLSDKLENKDFLPEQEIIDLIRGL